MVKVVCYNCGAEFETGRVEIGDGKDRDYFLYEDLPPCPHCGAEGCLGHRRPAEEEEK